MRGLVLSLVAVGAAVWAGGASSPPGLQTDAALASPLSSFVLQTAEGACVLSRGQADQGGISPVTVDADCQALFPGFADVTSWQERPDGSVRLVGAQDRTVMEFAQADGAGFESYGAGAPIALILPAN